MAPVVLIFLFVFTIVQWVEGSNRYWLYDRNLKDWAEMYTNGTVPKRLWHRHHPIKVLVHGYNNNSLPIMQLLEAHFMNALAREYARYDHHFNIIAVDWSKLADNPQHKYADSVKNVKPAAEDIVVFLIELLYNGVFSYFKNVHFLGFSMGAHVAGAVGNMIGRVFDGEKIGRITGLDPAGPMFSTITGKNKTDMSIVLDYEDAQFVDIIHTNQGSGSGTVLKGRMGSMLELGHIDFYPNGGEVQPEQCTDMKDQIDLCSHQESVLFYAYSLRFPEKYIGCRCHDYSRFLKRQCECEYQASSLQPMGDLTRAGQRGRYYLTITEPITPSTFKQYFFINKKPL